ncbi:hypothetical protein M569_17503 [Genlisea aurea]|uniref:Uncharacterized protein n=1 Tax=Genlisea aurea TaxID=192259 RepID=S8BYT2_9LAMI|nr:hypothetical protein M569_17503 [Genlisea aurea]
MKVITSPPNWRLLVIDVDVDGGFVEVAGRVVEMVKRLFEPSELKSNGASVGSC